MPRTPTNASAQNGVGLSNRTRIVKSSTFSTFTLVVGGERLAVVPGDATLQLPDDCLAVLGETAVFEIGNFGREHRIEDPVRIPRGEWLVEHARAVLVLGARREVRIDERHGLPKKKPQRAAATGLGRLVGGLRLREGDPLLRQQHPRHRRRQADGEHAGDEASTRHASVLHGADQRPQFDLVHQSLPFVRRADRSAGHSQVARQTSCPLLLPFPPNIATPRRPRERRLRRQTRV